MAKLDNVISQPKPNKKRPVIKIGDAVVVRNEMPSVMNEIADSKEKEWYEKRARWRRGIVVAFDDDNSSNERVIGHIGAGRPIVLLDGQKSWDMFDMVRHDSRADVTHSQLLKLGLKDPPVAKADVITNTAKMSPKAISKTPIKRAKTQAERVIEAQQKAWASLPKASSKHEQTVRNVCQSAGLSPGIIKQQRQEGKSSVASSSVCGSVRSLPSSVSSTTSRTSIVHRI
eukprot:TRINITY_DN29135_c0_g1_i1.p1 TRINITY_DN29135_c0_g1~~TRINITY_DN29135_c0_g1_i1.p1  ORF type:complete len:246 (+),score=37.50 TRINITY_DN29135_c0_g1_i1:52-738(+)